MIVTTHWFDLPVRNMVDAMSFYESLFGWTFSRLPNSNEPDYYAIQAGEHLIGGLRGVETQGQPVGVGPVLYFTVPHLETAVHRVSDLGGRLMGGAVNLGDGRGVYQWFRDRENNLLALWAKE
jgi:predicted enzyme related to lactoylglutathione lyase